MQKNYHSFFKIIIASAFIFSSSFISYSQEIIPSIKTIGSDLPVKVISATASSMEPGQGITNSYDDNTSTIYHSAWSGSTMPIYLTYNFTASDMDYILYTTRISDGNNGNFKVVEVQVKSEGETTFTKITEVDLQGTPGVKKIEFPSTVLKVISVRFVVKSAASDNGINYASCSEMQFFKKDPNGFDPSTIFTDASCSELKTGVTQTQINTINSAYYKALANGLFNKTYPAEFRVQEYKAWPHPDDFSRNNRVGTYSLCDNPTGIFARQGDSILVFVNETSGYNISLCLKNYNQPEGNGYWNNTYYALSKGVNKVIADRDGLFYVFYHTPDHLTAPKVKIHFGFGRVNGYFDNQKHTATDWSRIINATKYEYFDLVGKYAHLSFPTDKFKANAATTGSQLIQTYDDLVFAERDFMGYYKYPNRNPYNRSHFVVMYHSYMYSTSYHTGYNISTIDGLTQYTNVRSYPWGPAHEVGHSNQHNPLIKWVGTTEVTNNIQSLFVQTLWGNTSRMTEESRYQEAYDYLLTPKIAHCQAGIWQKLIPFWQLQLFFGNVLDQKDFYAKVYEGARTRPTGSSAGDYQINFVRLVIDSAKVDLTEFFDVWGYLRSVNATIEDYWTEQLTISPTTVNLTKSYIKNKNFPVLPYKIQYITDTNWQLYKNKSKVIQGSATRNGNTITASNWQNVVAYECYRGADMVKVSEKSPIDFAGRFDSTCIVYAVQYDGEKFEVMRGKGAPIITEVPKISNATQTYWYYVKNMSNEQTNTSGTPRGFCSLYAAAAGNTVRGTSQPVFRTQKWKLTQVTSSTIGLVNEAGLYLGKDLMATTTPTGWNLEEVTQGGSSGYRFKSIRPTAADPTKMEDVVAHLNTSNNLMNYTNADEASIWQFIPESSILLSDTKDNFYKIKTLRSEDGLSGSYLAADNASNTLLSVKENGSEWKFVTNSTGFALMNKENKYLIISGGKPVLSTTIGMCYPYLSTCEGAVGLRLTSGTFNLSSMTSLSTVNTIVSTTNSSIAGYWSLVPVWATGVKEIMANAANYKIYVKNRKIIVSEEAGEFIVYNVNGMQIPNENLSNGIYLVKGKNFSTKVLVK